MKKQTIRITDFGLNYKPEYDFDYYKSQNITENHNEQIGNRANYNKVTKQKLSTKCNHNGFIDYETSDIVCKKCLTIYRTHMISERYSRNNIENSNFKYWERTDDKIRWNKYTLDYLNGVKNKELTDQLWYEMALEIPDPFTWYDVYKVFHTYRIGYDKTRTGISDHWMGFGHYVGIPMIINDKILKYADKYTNKKIRINRINYNFLLYKFTQMFGEIQDQEKFIPLKNTEKWITGIDEWWKEFCIQENLKFIPTKIHKIYWNKDKYMNTLKLNLKLISEYTTNPSVEIHIKNQDKKYKKKWIKKQITDTNYLNTQTNIQIYKGHIKDDFKKLDISSKFVCK